MLSDWLYMLSYLFLLSCDAKAEQFYVIPNNTSCPRNPCYTLTDIVLNSSQYFASNTVIAFLPGHHHTKTTWDLSVLIKNVRNISMIGYDHTDSDSKSVIQCTGSLGFAFINVTTLKIEKLQFNFCGARFPSKLTVDENFVRLHDFTNTIPLTNNHKVTFYFLQTINVTISEVAISNSTGAGLLGINMLGLSNISQAVLNGNRPNCLIIFLNIPITSEAIPSTALNIEVSCVMFGRTSKFLNWGATGLGIMLAQTTYNVNIHINKFKTYNNMKKFKWYGNLHFILQNWACHCSMIQVKQMVSVSMVNIRDITRIYLNSNTASDSTLPTCNCSKQGEYAVHISEGYFDRVGITMETYSEYCDARIKLQNITVHNSTTVHALFIRGMKSIQLPNVKFTYNYNKESVLRIHDSNIKASGRCHFINNTGHIGVVFLYQSNIFFCRESDVKFSENKAQLATVILANKSTMKFQQTAELVGNEGRVGAAIALFNSSKLVFGDQSYITFLRNYAQLQGGAILADGSTIIVEINATILFMENEAYNGGALALQNGAKIMLKSHSQIRFRRNHAQYNGGALYIEEPILKFKSYLNIYKFKCFFRLPPKISSQAIPSLIFSNNTADSAGSSLYGGWVNFCTNSIGKVFETVFHFQAQELSTVSSNPTRVCVCRDNLPDCSITHYNVTAYPGETFQISAVAVGQMNGTVPFIVQSKFISVNSSSPPHLKPLQKTQSVRGTCTSLTYTIISSHQTEEMILAVEKLDKLPTQYIIQNPIGNKNSLIFTDLHLHIQLNPCPLGFVLNNSSCICHPQLLHNEIKCNNDTQTVNRQSPKWINATFVNTPQYGVLVHNHCPFDYCKPERVDLDLKDPDEQCAFHRSGILCGACQNDLSHVFGTSACRECSSLWALLWVPVTALAGIALVVLLIVLNLTVSVGTINGLIFYANIVRANHATFFPPSTTNTFLSWFIAWINLDLGIETCFYNGLDGYVKTWLQFIFPLYIWLIVVLIIVFSHYFDKIARLSGRNAVSVLATLFLLSYAKLLRIIITVFSFTLIKYPDKTVIVWLYDGNVNYLEGKHIPLIVAAVILLLAISVPYTGMLLFIQCFQKLSSHKLFSWIHKLKPFFDAYTGPYKDRHRYWTGLLLLVRAALFLIFSVNAIANPVVNLLLVTVTAFSLITLGVVAGRVYKTWILNTIEYSFLLNLGVLSRATFYTRASDQEDSGGATGHGQKAVVYTSVVIALVTFTVIVVMHIVKKAKSFSQCNRLFSESIYSNLSKMRKKATLTMERKHHHSPFPTPAVSPTSIQLRESLLEYCTDD